MGKSQINLGGRNSMGREIYATDSEFYLLQDMARLLNEGACRGIGSDKKSLLVGILCKIRRLLILFILY